MLIIIFQSTYVNQHIEETGQQDTQYPIIENQTGDLIFFGSGGLSCEENSHNSSPASPVN